MALASAARRSTASPSTMQERERSRAKDSTISGEAIGLANSILSFEGGQ
jgi:hypothetical protein